MDRTVDRQLDRQLDRELVLVLKALSDPSRLRIVGLIAEHGRTVEDLAALVRLTPRVVARHLDLLVAARLAEARPGPRPITYTLRIDTLHEIGRSVAELEGAAEARQAAADLAAGRDPEEAKVLRAFIADGRLSSIRPRSGSDWSSCATCATRCSPRTAATRRRRSTSASRCSTRTSRRFAAIWSTAGS